MYQPSNQNLAVNVVLPYIDDTNITTVHDSASEVSKEKVTLSTRKAWMMPKNKLAYVKFNGKSSKL